MPTAIPVILEHRQFASQNQARLHYSAMLHRYQPGQTISAADRADLQELLQRHPLHRASTSIEQIKVTPGGFKRPCFTAVLPDQSMQRLSYIHCIRNSPRPDDPLTDPVPEQKKKAQSAGDAFASPNQPPQPSKPQAQA